MVARSAERSPSSHLTSGQRRNLTTARKVLGGSADVRAYAAGRANARWAAGAGRVIGVFIAAFAGALLLLHVVIIPGALVLLILFDTVKPRRGVAVTAAGVVELKLSAMGAKPHSVLATATHAAVVEARVGPANGKGTVGFGAETVVLRDRDLRMLQDAIPASIGPVPQHVGRTPSIPPPPPPVMVNEVPAKSLPRWREATFLWIVAHVGIALALVVGIIAASNVVAAAIGRDTAQTAAGADVYLWGILAGPLTGWLLFVYWRGTFRARMLFLACFAGGALLLACIVNIAYSPAIAH